MLSQPILRKSFMRVREAIEDPVLGSHIWHMKVQRAMLNGETSVVIRYLSQREWEDSQLDGCCG